MSRRRSYSRRRLSKSFWQFTRNSWQVVVVFVSAVLVMIGYCWLARPPAFVQGLTIGIVATTLAAAFFVFFLVGTGSALTMAGNWAESFSRDEIKKATKRGFVWGALNNIELGGFDVDHLVIAPGGVLAIETKAHVLRLGRERAQADIEQAREAARKAGSIMRSKHVGMPSEVVPVLAVWGSRATQTLPPTGRVINGVHVIGVVDLGNWLAQFRYGRVSEDNAREALSRLREFRDTRELRDPVLS